MGARLRMIRAGSSLRMQAMRATEAVIGSSPRMRAAAGVTGATRALAERRITKPIAAVQKPMTGQGSGVRNNASQKKSNGPRPFRDSATADSHITAAMVAVTRMANKARLPLTRDGFARWGSTGDRAWVPIWDSVMEKLLWNGTAVGEI